MDKNGRAKHAVEVFQKLKLENWSLSNQTIGQGAQSGVCTVKRKDGAKGVFRCLPPNPDDKAIKRFRREVDGINRIRHANVMNLLESSSDSPYWYISPLGKDFHTFWKSIQNKFDYGKLESIGISLIRSLAQGLSAIHEEGIVHRDLKPSNIVVYDDENPTPVLIDFGVLWLQNGVDRLTDEDEAIGNARYSPDTFRQRMDSYTPWGDIFELIQVFQWMFYELDEKHYWQRPLHWRYIRYPASVSPSFSASLRAIGAVTSLEETSPKNGKELVTLIDKLFMTNQSV